MKSVKMDIPLRPRVKDLHFSPTLEINERVRLARAQGKEMIHLGFGESPFPVHPHIQNALAQHADKNMYLPSAGLPQLRQKVSDYYQEKFGLKPIAYKSIIGPGSKELIYDIQIAVKGDLLLPVPSWVSYAPQANLTGDHVIRIPTTLEDRYHVTPNNLEKTILESRQDGWNPKKLILTYPNNPTGLSIPSARLAEIAEVCKRYGVLVISDEIYGLVHHRGEHISIAGVYPEGTIVTTGLSKHLSLGGFRVGIALVPEELNDIHAAMVRIASETWSTVAAPIQYAILCAFENDPEIESYIQTCTKIHSLVSSYLRQVLLEIGIDYPPLDGGFYLYPDFEIFRKGLEARGIATNEELVRHLIDEIQIVTLPGSAFGDDSVNMTIRFAPCDYEGLEALEYLRENPNCTVESLVANCCRNIRLAGQRLREYFLEMRV